MIVELIYFIETYLPLSKHDNQQIKTWLDAIAKKDAQAFHLLYKATSPKLFGFLIRILHKREWAEEALQESFINIWNNAGSYQEHLSAPMTWISTIARNKAYDMLRRINEAVDIDGDIFYKKIIEELEDSQPTPIEALQMANDRKVLACCFALLDALPRQIIILAFYYDFSHSEVAEHLQLPIGTIKTLIRRNLIRLRSSMIKYDNEEVFGVAS